VDGQSDLIFLYPLPTMLLITLSFYTYE